MTNKEKDLLLRDLCARLSDKTYIEIVDKDGNVYDEVELESQHINILRYDESTSIRPYLRLLSSMTEDEKDELYDWGWAYEENNIYSDGSSDANGIYQNYQKDIQEIKWLIDWLIAHHFDFRGLIEKGLALVAPEDMYKTK